VLTFKQEDHQVFDAVAETLTCVLDSTNQTSYNWKESKTVKNGKISLEEAFNAGANKENWTKIPLVDVVSGQDYTLEPVFKEWYDKLKT